MRIKSNYIALLCSLGFVTHGLGQVPSLINYQGRLADANGAPVTGSKNFTLSIYDGETEGSLLYSEDIGAVTLDDNGVYSFQFGESGASQATATKSVGVADGIKNVFNTVLPDSAMGVSSIGDGTYTWTPTNGSSSPTSFIGSYDAASKTASAIYIGAAPEAGTNISVIYQNSTGGIVEALASGSHHWIELGIDGVIQQTRQRVVAVPFAARAGVSYSSEIASVALSAPGAEAMARQAQDLAELALTTAQLASANLGESNVGDSVAEFFTDNNGHYDTVIANGLRFENDLNYANGFNEIGNGGQIDVFPNTTLRFVRLRGSGGGFNTTPNFNASGTIYFQDGTSQDFNKSHEFPRYSREVIDWFVKPENPELIVTRIVASCGSNGGGGANLSIWDNGPRQVDVSVPPDFFEAGYEYKLIPAFTSRLDNTEVSYGIADQGTEFTLIQSPTSGPLDWSTPADIPSDPQKLRIIYKSPNSTSETDFTIPLGFTMLRRLKIQ